MSLIALDSFALWKRAPSLASTAEERIFFMMEGKTSMAPLIGGDGESGTGEIVVFFGSQVRKK